MLVKDHMTKVTVTVSEDEPIRNIVELIFNFRYAGIPVIKNKVVVGIVTESDVLHNLFPSISEVIADYGSSLKYEEIEQNLKYVIYDPVKKIMNRDIKFIAPDTPIIKALSSMLINKIGRLVVVNKKKELLGVISQGDIFRALVGTELPQTNATQFRDWLAYHYDFSTRWDERIKYEIPSIVKIFKQKQISKVLDIMCGTGNHTINLAEKGINVTGIDDSSKMIQVAKNKLLKLPELTQSKIKLIHGSFIKSINKEGEKYQAAIFMGNALLYLPYSWKEVLFAVNQKLTKKSLLIIHMRNLELLLKQNHRFNSFVPAKSRYLKRGEYIFHFFYTAAKEDQKYHSVTMSVDQFDGRIWSQSGINSTPIADLKLKELRKILIKLGFRKIGMYGYNNDSLLFEEKYNSRKHHWLNIIAEK